MANENGGMGTVRIDNEVLSSIAAIAVLRIPGLHHITTSFVDSLWRFFRRNRDAGVKVVVGEGEVSFELGVVVDYGVSIPEVTFHIQKTIREEVERMSGLKVARVDVIVHGVHAEAGQSPAHPSTGADAPADSERGKSGG